MGTTIRYAHLRPEMGSDHLAVMIGGVPRSAEQQQGLPVVNAFFGRLALGLRGCGTQSLMYNHPGTGGSSGSLAHDTLEGHVATLVGLIDHFRETQAVERVSLIGMSMGGYVAARAISRIELGGLQVVSTALLSPAAYPSAAELLPYGPEFSATIRADWPVAESPVFDDVRDYMHSGGNLLLSYFQHDDPPIPRSIQNAYGELVQEGAQGQLRAIQTIVAGAAHNFRKLQAVTTAEEGDALDYRVIDETAKLFTEFVGEPMPKDRAA